jgi:hypothetical protein
VPDVDFAPGVAEVARRFGEFVELSPDDLTRVELVALLAVKRDGVWRPDFLVTLGHPLVVVRDERRDGDTTLLFKARPFEAREEVRALGLGVVDPRPLRPRPVCPTRGVAPWTGGPRQLGDGDALHATYTLSCGFDAFKPGLLPEAIGPESGPRFRPMFD